MCYKVKRAMLLSFLIFSFISANAQNKDSLFYFSGKVLSKYGGIPISFAHIVNRTRHTGVSADTLGNFNIWAKQGDSLNISAIGFDYLQYKINHTNSDSIDKIYMKTRFYDIPEATIYYLGTYKEFEYKVLNLKLPESKVNTEIQKMFKHVETPAFMEPTITSPASLIYSLFSKEAKDIKKYVKLTAEDKVTEKVLKKFNMDLVRNLTGLNEEEAYEMIKFCNFKNEFILGIDEYKLYAEILKKYEAFKKSKEDSLKTE